MVWLIVGGLGLAVFGIGMCSPVVSFEAQAAGLLIGILCLLMAWGRNRARY